MADGGTAGGDAEGGAAGSAPVRSVQPVAAAHRRKLWGVVALGTVSLALLPFFLVVSDRSVEAVSAACRYLPPPWTMWAGSVGGLLAGASCVVLCVRCHGSGRRAGQEGLPGALGGLAAVLALLAGFAALLDVLLVWLTVQDALEAAAEHYRYFCEG